MTSLAEELLVAVADGTLASLELASSLTRAVLDDPAVQRAFALDDLLRTRSPFALVRAVELAEILLSQHPIAYPAGRSRRHGV